MTSMTREDLASAIITLKAKQPTTASCERQLLQKGCGNMNVWNKSQKEHWCVWLTGYNGPGCPRRKEWNRTAEFIYNHIQCPPMVLWLGEAAGVEEALVIKAKNAALRAQPRFASQCAAIRAVIPWTAIEIKLGPSGRVAGGRRTRGR